MRVVNGRRYFSATDTCDVAMAGRDGSGSLICEACGAKAGSR